jgi:hypothetical protein
MTMLLMSGNFPNFWNMPRVPQTGIVGNVDRSSRVSFITMDCRRKVITASLSPGAYSLTFFNSAGRRISDPLFGRSEIGVVSFPFKNDLQPGAYWVSLKTASGSIIRRMVIAH